MGVALGAGIGLDLALLRDAALGEHIEQLRHDAAAGQRVVVRAVVIEARQTETVCHEVELEALHVRQQRLRERQRVEEDGVKLDAAAARRRVHETDVELRVVRDQRAVPRKFEELLHGFALGRRVEDVAVRDAGELGDVGRDVALRVHKGLEAR